MDATVEPGFILDQTLALERSGEDLYTSHTDDRYWNMIGPFGGWMAALMLKAALADNDPAFEPVAMTVDFLKAPPKGPLVLRRQCDRAGRTTAFWRVDLETPDGRLCARSLVTLGPHRSTVAFSERRMPETLSAEEAADGNRTFMPVQWAKLYDCRIVKGRMGEGKQDAHSLEWIREADGRPLDYLSLAALCDSPFPRLFIATGRASSISTVTMTTYFHVSLSELAGVTDDYILCDSVCERSNGGFYDQHSRFFEKHGSLLATSHQMVWYDRQE